MINTDISMARSSNFFIVFPEEPPPTRPKYNPLFAIHLPAAQIL